MKTRRLRQRRKGGSLRWLREKATGFWNSLRNRKRLWNSTTKSDSQENAVNAILQKNRVLTDELKVKLNENGEGFVDAGVFYNKNQELIKESVEQNILNNGTLDEYNTLQNAAISGKNGNELLRQLAIYKRKFLKEGEFQKKGGRRRR